MTDQTDEEAIVRAAEIVSNAVVEDRLTVNALAEALRVETEKNLKNRARWSFVAHSLDDQRSIRQRMQAHAVIALRCAYDESLSQTKKWEVALKALQRIVAGFDPEKLHTEGYEHKPHPNALLQTDEDSGEGVPSA